MCNRRQSGQAKGPMLVKKGASLSSREVKKFDKGASVEPIASLCHLFFGLQKGFFPQIPSIPLQSKSCRKTSFIFIIHRPNHPKSPFLSPSLVLASAPEAPVALAPPPIEAGLDPKNALALSRTQSLLDALASTSSAGPV